MIDLVRAELLKVRTTRGWYVYLGSSCCSASASGDTGTAEDPARSSCRISARCGRRRGLRLAARADPGDHGRHDRVPARHDHADALDHPPPGVVVVGKAIAAISSRSASRSLRSSHWRSSAPSGFAAVGADNKLADPEVLGAAAKLLLAAPIWALVGIAVGVLVQSQVAALVGTLIWIFLAETIIVVAPGALDVGGLSDYLPFQALDAADGTNPDLLPYWTAVGVSLAWAPVLGAAGTERLRRRDIT